MKVSRWAFYSLSADMATPEECWKELWGYVEKVHGYKGTAGWYPFARKTKDSGRWFLLPEVQTYSYNVEELTRDGAEEITEEEATMVLFQTRTA